MLQANIHTHAYYTQTLMQRSHARTLTHSRTHLARGDFGRRSTKVVSQQRNDDSRLQQRL